VGFVYIDTKHIKMKYIDLFESFIISEGRVPRDERIEIFKDVDCLIVAPLSKKAASKYGAYTKWCTSAPSNDYIWNGHNIPNHHESALVYIIFNNHVSTSAQKKAYLRLSLLDKKNEEGELTTKQKIEYENLKESGEGLDLSKIAINYNTRTHKASLWSANNMEYRTDNVYTLIESLPINPDAKVCIGDYMSDYYPIP
jgi:hypothetical protein